MATERVNDLHAFKVFVDAQLVSGEDIPTVDEVIARWSYENESKEERTETLEGIRSGIADVEAGRLIPAREAVAQLRRKYGLTEVS